MPDNNNARPNTSYTGKKVMIVEDNEINRLVLDSTLKQFNLNVAIVENGFDAVQYLKSNVNVDLILMDLHMPCMDGFHATETIRRDLNLDIPIVVLTASSVANERQRSFEAGADDFLNKPFTSEQLRSCLHKFLGDCSANSGSVDSRHQHAAPPEFDISTLLQMEDAEIIQSIHDLFEKLVPENLQELSQCARDQDWEKVSFLAHRLKSSLGVIQIESIHKNLCSIETLSKQKRELNNIPPMIAQSITTYNVVAPLIRVDIEKELTRLHN